MDNINFNKTDNLITVNSIIGISDYDYILYINLDRTSDNIKELIRKHQPEFANAIKINVKITNKYKILDNNNNFKLEEFHKINFSGKLIKVKLEFSEKYLNFYIQELTIMPEPNKQIITNNKKYNINKNKIIRNIVKL